MVNQGCKVPHVLPQKLHAQPDSGSKILFKNRYVARKWRIGDWEKTKLRQRNLGTFFKLESSSRRTRTVMPSHCGQAALTARFPKNSGTGMPTGHRFRQHGKRSRINSHGTLLWSSIATAVLMIRDRQIDHSFPRIQAGKREGKCHPKGSLRSSSNRTRRFSG